MAETTPAQNLYTCLSCAIAFFSADDQRVHYRSDHHRYNMKRRVAGLLPVDAETFNQKVLERQSETAVAAAAKSYLCTACGKNYTTENAYRSHIASKKHRENELKASKRASEPKEESPSIDQPAEGIPTKDAAENKTDKPVSSDGFKLIVDPNATEEEIEKAIDEKIAAARARLSPSNCLFCPSTSSSVEDNLAHMFAIHTFFVPDTEFLVDLSGLITYLGEKIAVGNVCIYCGAEFRTLEAVRKHMLDKGHCKIAYDTDEERLETSDFYDFTTSYPDAEKRKPKTTRKKEEEAEVEEWEDVSNDGEDADEVVDVSEEESDLDVDEYCARLGDTPYELILPSGARVAHRHVLRQHRPAHQLVTVRRARPGEDASAVAEVRRMLGEKSNTLVPTKGGFGAFGSGMQMVKARNPGEAREAGRHVREFRDMKRREDFKTRVGFIHNHQKHFRDPLLQ